jgi:hypothetical protein
MLSAMQVMFTFNCDVCCHLPSAGMRCTWKRTGCKGTPVTPRPQVITLSDGNSCPDACHTSPASCRTMSDRKLQCLPMVWPTGWGSMGTTYRRMCTKSQLGRFSSCLYQSPAQGGRYKERLTCSSFSGMTVCAIPGLACVSCILMPVCYLVWKLSFEVWRCLSQRSSF